MTAGRQCEKLQLGENHRRAVSAVLREVENLCTAVEHWVDHRGGLFLVPEEDLSPDQKKHLHRLVAEIHAELRNLDEGMTLDHSRQSRRRALMALISTAIADLEDSAAASLRGYGPLSDEARMKIDGGMKRLIGVLERMSRVTLNGARGSVKPDKV